MCGCLSCAPALGAWPTTQACALTGNRTSDLLLCRPALNPLSYTSQGKNFFFTYSMSIIGLCKLSMRQNLPKWNLFIKKLCIHSYMFKLQSPSKYSPFDAIHILRLFFPLLKQFLNTSLLMPFIASAIFCFTSSTFAKYFRLRTFSFEETKNIRLG